MLAFSTSRGEILVDSAIVYTEKQASTKTMETRKVRLNSEAMAALLAQKTITYTRGGKVFSDPSTTALGSITGSISVLPIPFSGLQQSSAWASDTADRTTRATRMPLWA